MEILTREPCHFAARTEIWTVRSEAIDQQYRVIVTRPQSRAPAAEAIAALLVLDGDINAGVAVSAVSNMAFAGEVPPMVVVSVCYPLNVSPSWVALRNRDLTPTAFPELQAYMERMLGEPVPGTGGADAFLKFLNRELKPAIQAAYGVDPGQWTLAGQSFAGLFSVHALFTDPAAFRRYAIVSPTLWWKRPYMFDRACAFAAESAAVKVDAFFCAGEFERSADLAAHVARLPPEMADSYEHLFGGHLDFVEDAAALVAILDRRKGVRATARMLPNETHNSIMGTALSHGLRWLNARDDASA